MTANILSCEDLRTITGYQRAADIERCLREQGIRIFYGRKGPWTTLDLINQAGGFVVHAAPETLEPNQIL